MKNVFLAITFCASSLLLQGCKIRTDVVFSEELQTKFASSAPIKLSFRDTRGYSFYLILQKSTEKGKGDEYFIVLRSLGENQNLANNPKLNITLENREFIILDAIDKSKVVGYNMEPYKMEEELKYKTDYKTLSRIANAKEVTVRVDGELKTVVGSFQRLHATKAVRNFLLNAY